jgi:glycylpeptide N-tetradecanoyltransferase
MDMLEENLKPLNLKQEEADILRMGLRDGKFNKAAKIVHYMLARRGERETATVVEEMGPLYDPHDFWDNQPVPKIGEKLNEEEYNKPIEVKGLEDVRKEPLNLPAGYNWANLNLADDKEAEELYVLLTKNYVEDDDAMFRFDYSVPFVRWALLPPGQHPEWLCAVRGGAK